MSDITFMNLLGDALEDAARRDLSTEASKGRVLSPLRSLPAFAWVIIPLLLIAAAGAGAYAANSSVRDMFNKVWPGLDETGQVQEYNLSQTIEGITIRLEHAYADSNVVIVGLSASGLPEEYVRSFRISGEFGSLKTADGTSLRRVRSFNAPPGLDAWGEPSSSQEARLLHGFDASSVTSDNPEELELEMTILVPRNERSSSIDGFVGPFTFNFTAPMYSGEQVTQSDLEIGMTVEAAGIPVTLERLVITPGETRAIMRVEETASGGSLSPSAIQIETPKTRNSGEPPPVAQVQGLDGGRTEASFYESFANDPGRWTLTVIHLGGFDDRIEGPWVFEFTVPPSDAQTSPDEVDISPAVTAEANGIEVRLDRVVMTPGATRVTVWMEESVYPGIGGDGVLITTITDPAGHTWSAQQGTKLSSDEGFAYAISFFDGFWPQSGEWELRLNRVKDSAPWNLKEWPESDLIGDPWALRFEVP